MKTTISRYLKLLSTTFQTNIFTTKKILLIGLLVVVAISGFIVKLIFFAQVKPSVTARLTFPLHVVGNFLTTSKGIPIRLIGVDHSGSEYACAQGWGFFDGPTDPASVAAMRTWHINAVRIPLNEDCWLGINGVKPMYSRINYQNQIIRYVENLNAQKIVAILDLHWNAPGLNLALGQQYMADENHSPEFWNSVGRTFKRIPGVIFDLYNEPHNISWSCWLNGCTTPGGWQAVGMQQLVNTVRNAGATQPILLNGNDWGGDLSQWLKYEPHDPLSQLIAGAHIYNYSGCNSTSCWNSTIAPVAAVVPVITGEFGDTSCSNFDTTYMNWADQQNISYLAWTWNTWGSSCKSLALISTPNGTPTSKGRYIREHFNAIVNQAMSK